MAFMPDWSGLQPHLLVEIASRVRSMEDFMAFRGVCSSWRASVTEDNSVSWRSGVVGVPLLMLPEKDGSDEREFYSLSEKMIWMRVPLPEAKGRRCMEVGFRWLLTLENSNSGEVSLLNPFSPAQIHLPNYTTFPGYEVYSEVYENDPNFSFIEKAVLSSDPADDSSSSSKFVLFVIAEMGLGFWRSGDENRTKIGSDLPGFENMCYCNPKLYVVHYVGDIIVWDPSSSTTDDHYHLTAANIIMKVDRSLVSNRLRHLMQSQSKSWYDDDDDELLISHDIIPRKTASFGVIRIDVKQRNYEEMNCSDKEAVFIGGNAPVSVPASNCSFRCN